MKTETTISFPAFTGVRCLMMPYIQGEPDSVPDAYRDYADILRQAVIKRGDIGYLTIDESVATAGKPHRGKRAKFARALHTEAGRRRGLYAWGNPWGGRDMVLLDDGVEILLANNLDDSCAVWDATHADTSLDGDIGHVADQYPYDTATMMKAGEVHRLGILQPHESLPVRESVNRQFLRIVSSGVHGREPYFTVNPLVLACLWTATHEPETPYLPSKNQRHGVRPWSSWLQIPSRDSLRRKGAVRASRPHCGSRPGAANAPSETDRVQMKRFRPYSERAGKDGWCRWVTPIMRRYKLVCCDCSLVHEMEFQALKVNSRTTRRRFNSTPLSLQDYRVAFRVRRKNGLTRQLRKS